MSISDIVYGAVRGRIETIIAKNVDVDDTDFRNPAELTKELHEKLPRRAETRRASSSRVALRRSTAVHG